MKTIRINFSDFSRNYNKRGNVFFKTLEKYYNVEISDTPDFLFYSSYGFEFQKYSDCIKIFYTTENVRPNFNECDYAIGSDYLVFEDRYFHTTRFVQREPYNSERDFINRKFCNFIYSRTDSGVGGEIRKNFCLQLMKYRHIDCPGRVLNNMQDAIEPRNGHNWVKGKLDFLRNYKFTIAFENSSSPGYITEKLLHPLKVYSVPIYWGDPCVTREFNPKALINCHDFNNFSEVIDYIKFLDTHEKEYLDIIHQEPMQADYDPNKYNIEKFLINIIEKGKCYQPKDEDIRCWNESYKQRHYCLVHKFSLFEMLSDSDQILKFLKEWIKNRVVEDEISKQQTLVLFSSLCRIAIRDDIIYVNNPMGKIDYLHLFSILRPYNVLGCKKIRIGAPNVGGYVMLDPGRDGIAYSFCCKWHFPFDKHLADYGFKVYEYDGRFKIKPGNHPNIFFYPINQTTANEEREGYKNLEQIFRENGHTENQDIILQVNLRPKDGWDFFEHITEKQLCHFTQIVATFYELDRSEYLQASFKIFKKIQRTHQCIHFHFHNNVGNILCFGDFLVSSGIELTFVRRDTHQFVPSTDEYPTPLDAPTVTKYPDIYIGKFDFLGNLEKFRICAYPCR